MKKTTTYLALFSLVAIVAVSAVLLIGPKRIKLQYLNFKNNHYSIGDSVYVSEYFKKEKASKSIYLQRLVKSVDGYGFTIGEDISGEKMVKYKTDAIGTYLGYKIVPIKDSKGEEAFLYMYAIKPDLRLLKDGFVNLEVETGDKLVDNNFYVFELFLIK